MSALKQILLVALLVAGCGSAGCTAAQVEHGEDDVCSFIAKELPKLPSGKVKDAATATKLACDAEEALEGDKDGG